MRLQAISLLMALIVQCSYCDFIDYTEGHTLICADIDSSWSFQQNLQNLWGIVILHEIDRWLFIVACPVLCAMLMICISVYIKERKSLFRYRGSIFFSILVIEAVLNVYYFTHAMYIQMNPYSEPMPSDFPAFCFSTGVIHNLGKNMLFFYMLYFVLYTLRNMKVSIKQNAGFNPKFLHLLVVFLSIVEAIVIYFESEFGLNQFGLCGLSFLRSGTFELFLPLAIVISNGIFVGLSVFTFLYFKRHMPANDGLVKRTYYENQSVSFFVIGEGVILGVYDLSTLILYFNCFSADPKSSLQVFATIMNLTKICQAVFILYFVLTHKNARKKVKKTLRGIFQRKRKRSSFSDELYGLDFSAQNYEDVDLSIREKILEIKEEENQIDLLKVAQIMTMIAAVHIAHKEYFNGEQRAVESTAKRILFQERVSFTIDEQTLPDFSINISNLPKAAILKCTITMMAPRIFNKLLQSDGLDFVEHSFDLAKNYHKMYNIAEGNGGKSGEFFFFSHDYKYVLKTITKQEYNFIAENLHDFYDYYARNPNSLLAKIYGLYTIKGEDIGRKYDLILMKNILGCRREQVIRTYDMKGSKYDREVLSQEGCVNELISLTLKDTDFLNLEEKLHISNGNIRELRKALRRDTKFLKNFNLIDYSLLVVKVNWKSPPDNPGFWSSLQRIQSEKNPEDYYHIGLIDYMQAWNISKKGENWWKSLIGKKEISAQEPNFYQRRFMEFIEEITMFPDRNETDLEELEESEFTTRPKVFTVSREPELILPKGQQYELSENIKPILHTLIRKHSNEADNTRKDTKLSIEEADNVSLEKTGSDLSARGFVIPEVKAEEEIF